MIWEPTFFSPVGYIFTKKKEKRKGPAGSVKIYLFKQMRIQRDDNICLQRWGHEAARKRAGEGSEAAYAAIVGHCSLGKKQLGDRTAPLGHSLSLDQYGSSTSDGAISQSLPCWW